MGGGLMQLVAYGAQDIYLTGNPQITFFKVVYRRHTNFSMESIQQTLTGTTTANGNQTCTISRNGDLIHKTYIEFKPAIHGTIQGCVTDLIDNVELEIGGQMIDRQYMDWMAIWWELSTPESKVDGLGYMFDETAGAQANSEAKVYIPLQFWFCRNPGLALPLIALQYHEVKLKITWGASYGGNMDDSSKTAISSSDKAEVWVDYIYLDTDERRRFAQVSHEYLIEQVQRQTNAANKSSVNLNFNHPVKELIWVCAPSSNGYGNGCRFIPLNGDNDNVLSAAVAGSTNSNTWTPKDGDNELKMKIQLNGHDRFAARECRYFQLVQPYEHHTRVPHGGDVNNAYYTHSGKVAELTNAQIMNKIHKPIKLRNLNVQTRKVSGGASILTYYVGNTLVNGAEVAAELCIDVDGGTGRAVTGASSALNAILAPVHPVTQPPLLKTHAINIAANEYFGVQTADATAAVWAGQTSYEYQELPTLMAGDNDSPANIFCYSFALKPEEHQPSGTCNFSRIDNAKLMTDSGNFSANTSASLKVFAVNYNVLRIMSGMGGLAYSN
jgi:hypothetical protein